MKNIGTYILAVLGLMMVLVVACTEEMSEVKLDSQLSTSKIQNIASDSAVVTGYVIAEGSGLSERGVCYSTTENPTTAGDKTVYEDGGSTSTFNVTLKDLTYATKYYARAYAVNSSGTIYGEQLTFTTLPVVPTVTTGEFEPESGTASATGGGNVTSDGGADVTARGVCYSTTENPTLTNSFTVDGEGLGDFASTLTNLNGLTTYYVRAYATNSAGTAYGAQVSFTTLEPTLYMMGAALNGWGPWNDKEVKMTYVEPGVFEVTAVFNNTNQGFRFFAQADWGPTSYNYPFFTTVDPTFENAADDDSNFKFIGAPGPYKVRVNLNEGTVEIVSLYMMGAALNGWGPWNDKEVKMTYVSDGEYTATAVFTSGESFRFFAQADWSPTSYNYPYFTTVDALFVNANDDDSNFKYVGATGSVNIRVNLNTKVVSVE
jgi:hypothetical protein